MVVKTKNRLMAIGGEVPTNGAAELIDIGKPYVINLTIRGVADLLFHRWNCESVEEKGKAAKGSKTKKTDDIESYVWRNDKNELCLPGSYLRGAIVGAAKFRQDPRSPRKSACDIYKAGVVVLTELSSFGVKDWDYAHKCRMLIQRSAITRVRPAIKSPWELAFQIQVSLAEYIRPEGLHEVVADAGRFVGLADSRPTYGRFVVANFAVAR